MSCPEQATENNPVRLVQVTVNGEDVFCRRMCSFCLQEFKEAVGEFNHPATERVLLG
jgi:hypothetical protein